MSLTQNIEIKNCTTEVVQDQAGSVLVLEQGLYVIDNSRKLLKAGKSYRVSIELIHSVPEESEVITVSEGEQDATTEPI